jgi:hypothetical protein
MLGFRIDFPPLLEGSDEELAVPSSLVAILSTLCDRDLLLDVGAYFLTR